MNIVLTAEHEHAGRVCQTGSELTLNDTDATALIAAGKAKAAVATSFVRSAAQEALSRAIDELSPHFNPTKVAAAPKATESTHDKEQQA